MMVRLEAPLCVLYTCNVSGIKEWILYIECTVGLVAVSDLGRTWSRLPSFFVSFLAPTDKSCPVLSQCMFKPCLKR